MHNQRRLCHGYKPNRFYLLLAQRFTLFLLLAWNILMHDTAELSIGALSVFHGLCTIWGFFPFQGFGSPAGRIDQNSYAFLQKKHNLGRFIPTPQT